MPTPPNELADLCESADGPSRELFAKVHEAMAGQPGWDYGRQARFLKYCEAEAWTDAALTLVPEGYFPVIDFVTSRCWIRDARGFDHDPPGHSVKAKTPALAICAAALRATNGGEHGRG